MSIAIRVVAHEQRRDRAENLAMAVGAKISWDQGEGAQYGYHTGAVTNHLRALKQLLHEETTDWNVILEDDSVLCIDFRVQLRKALEYAPTPVVGLYLGTGNPSGEAQRQIVAAVAKAQAWISADCLIGSVAYAIRRQVLADIIDFYMDRPAGEEPGLRISRWAQHHGQEYDAGREHLIAYTQPSLVNHLDDESIGRPFRAYSFPGRKAHRFGPRDCWCTSTVRLGHCPIWSDPDYIVQGCP